MILTVNAVDKVGMVRDSQMEVMPPEAWSFVVDMLLRNGKAQSRNPAKAVLGTPGVPPYWGFNYRIGAVKLWFYAGLQRVYATAGSTQYDVTRASGNYNTTESDRWSGGNFNGAIIINNGVDVPQMMTTIDPSTQVFSALTNWPANTRCRTLRFFKSYAVALDITKAGVRYPLLVKWSHQTDPGAIPSSWDHTNPAVDAGETPLADTQGTVVDLLAMGDTAIVYKEDSVWSMRLVGGDQIFAFNKKFSEFGILAPNCAAAIPDGSHVVLTANDVVLHNGQTFRSIAEDRIRQYIFDNLDMSRAYRCYVVTNTALHEVWVCVPNLGGVEPTTAYCWNWDTQAWSIKSLPNTSYIAMGYVDAGSTGTWDGDTGTWDSDSSTWNTVEYSSSSLQPIGFSAANTKIYDTEPKTFDPSGEIVIGSIERMLLSVPMQNEQPPDMFHTKEFRRLRPRITGTQGDIVSVSFYAVEEREGLQLTMTLVETQEFIIGTTAYLDFVISTRLFGLRFEGELNSNWTFHGYELEYEPVGD